MTIKIPVNPEVLRWARESVSISRSEAAERIKVDPDVLRGWEEGWE